MGGASSLTGDRYEETKRTDLLKSLKRHGALTAMLYEIKTPGSEVSDIWPDFRNKAKLPAHYSFIDMRPSTSVRDRLSGRSQKAIQLVRELPRHGSAVDVPSGYQSGTESANKSRPLWSLPVELVEQILKYLNRDDIKSLRLVSPELNDYTSQAAFKNVVVPFNTEIYGMLEQESKPDRRSKKRARISRPEYWWKNANGDEVYKGHGLDVFRGFGRHILRYGMSFEVTEESLSAPPLKSLTEPKTSFWGSYEWPYEEYRRFDTIAGLETAADETPRMTTAFSELTKVKELALSIDSGLGWLNGPDKSIRSRIFQHRPPVFGTCHHVPDRRTQAQRELWEYIETEHARVGEDVRTASLYRLEGVHPPAGNHRKGLLASVQPEVPYLDPHIVNEAMPHDLIDSISPEILEDFETPERYVLKPAATDAGVLFTSTTLQHSDAAQSVSPIIPATLTKAQKEWLLETEWAQRAFISSYMLSIIDNSATFQSIYTLNISSLSDRYISMLNRADFWTALPSLKSVTLLVVPSWRAVHKDEAGLVDTPRVDPTDRVDTFCELLRAQVAVRPGISKLTVGYTTGGEHAEGLHARNKLLMPAPLMPLRARMHAGLPLQSETASIQDAKLLRQVLLHFPYLEELTLRNCWTTPSALLQFIAIHDKFSLKHLTLDSVSLTAMLRPNGNVNAPQAVQQAAPQNPAPVPHMAGPFLPFNHNNAGGHAAPAQHWPATYQMMNAYIQTLIVQLQQMQANAGGMQQQQHINILRNQLRLQLRNTQVPHQQPGQGPVAQNQAQQAQQQIHFTQITQLNFLAAQVSTMQQMVAGQAVPVALHTNALLGISNSVLRTQPREGSWMHVMDQISPGTNLADFGSTHSQADPARITSLSSISFISCGYAKLPYHPGVDQSAIEVGDGFAASPRNPFFTKRYNALSPAMLSAKWACLGEIIQEVDPGELAALDAGWGLRHGWEDAEAARAVEFDGLLSGGTGRFTGRVQREDRVNTGTGAVG